MATHIMKTQDSCAPEETGEGTAEVIKGEKVEGTPSAAAGMEQAASGMQQEAEEEKQEEKKD